MPGSVTPGFFDRSALPQPLVRIAVRSPFFGDRWEAVTFVIDTGSPHTLIHASISFGVFGVAPSALEPVHWPDQTRVEGIGGGFAYRVVPASFGFPTLDGRLEVIDSVVHVGELRTQNLPPLLGMDLLSQFRVTVYGSNDFVELVRQPTTGSEQGQSDPRAEAGDRR